MVNRLDLGVSWNQEATWALNLSFNDQKVKKTSYCPSLLLRVTTQIESSTLNQCYRTQKVSKIHSYIY